MLLGIAIGRPASVDVTWTTILLARAALDRGARVRFFEPCDLEVDERGELVARSHAFDHPCSAEDMVAALHGHRAPRVRQPVAELRALMLRVAPLNPALLALVSLAEHAGVRVVNPPGALLQVSHKSWLASLTDVPTPATLVTRSAGAAHLFLARQGRPVVVKPANGSGGRHVTLVTAGDAEGLDRAFAAASAGGRHVVVQAYLEQAHLGEKRLVWMDGRVLGGYLRQRAPGEFRHNLKQGGSAAPTTISPAEHALVAPLGRHLLRAGIRLAGIDLIGQHVIEVNALNPGGSFHADRLHGTDTAGTIVEALLAEEPPDESRRHPWAHLGP